MVEVSVIVPVYNMEAGGKLEYCLDSLVGQTLQSLEIIAVDDASPDGSAQIIKRYEERYPGRVVRICSPENRRQGGARNLGLARAQGRYIGFMDADDWAAPDMFEKLLRKAVETGADVVGCDLCRVSSQTMVPTEREVCNLPEQTGVTDVQRRRSLLLLPGPVVTKLYERRIFFDPPFRFQEHISYEDNAAFLDLVMRYRHYEHVPEALYFYYQNPDSTTHTYRMKSYEDRMSAMRVMLQDAARTGALDAFREEVEYAFTDLFYRNTLFSYMLSPLKKDLRFLGALGREMRETFPGFQDNRYYKERVVAEEQALIRLHQKSTAAFLLYFQTKKLYRKIRYGRW